jgi:hypothetical protein
MKTVSRVFAALNEPTGVPAFVIACNDIVNKMIPNATFANPPVAWSVVQKHIKDLSDAEETARHGSPADVQDRNFKLGLVRTDMHLLKAFVQFVADNAAPGNAAAIIESAGLSVAKKPQRTKPGFAVKYGKVPGRARLEARSVGPRAVYYWMMSTDQHTWSSLPDTLTASTNVDGLTAGTTYYFRFRTLTKAGMSDWSVVVSIIAR